MDSRDDSMHVELEVNNATIYTGSSRSLRLIGEMGSLNSYPKDIFNGVIPPEKEQWLDLDRTFFENYDELKDYIDTTILGNLNPFRNPVDVGKHLANQIHPDHKGFYYYQLTFTKWKPMHAGDYDFVNPAAFIEYFITDMRIPLNFTISLVSQYPLPRLRTIKDKVDFIRNPKYREALGVACDSLKDIEELTLEEYTHCRKIFDETEKNLPILTSYFKST